MKDIGWMICRMVMGLRLGQMDLNTKEIIEKERSMDKAVTIGQTDLGTWENGLITESMEK
jgi:hypothetical protein